MYQFRPMSQWPGTATRSRRRSQFRSSREQTRRLLADELSRIRASEIVIEAFFTEDQIRLDGYPRAHATPSRPGVVLNFKAKGQYFRFPCDTYLAIDDNIRAISLTLQALRAVDRYGVTQHQEQYSGWKRLESAPAHGSREEAAAELARFVDYSPAAILGSPDLANEAYRRAARQTHPDHGGDEKQFAVVSAAIRVLRSTGQ